MTNMSRWHSTTIEHASTAHRALQRGNHEYSSGSTSAPRVLLRAPFLRLDDLMIRTGPALGRALGKRLLPSPLDRLLRLKRA